MYVHFFFYFSSIYILYGSKNPYEKTQSAFVRKSNLFTICHKHSASKQKRLVFSLCPISVS